MNLPSLPPRGTTLPSQNVWDRLLGGLTAADWMHQNGIEPGDLADNELRPNGAKLQMNQQAADARINMLERRLIRVEREVFRGSANHGR